VAAGGRVRRRAVFADGAARAGGRAAGGDDEASESDGGSGAYGDLAAQRSGGAVGPSGRGAAGSGSEEDSEGAPPGMASADLLRIYWAPAAEHSFGQPCISAGVGLPAKMRALDL
jgi:hypothetical protein